MIISDDADATGGSGTNTPAPEGHDDFFSSWDKPAIKRPSAPPSRTATPVNRAASPFLNAAAANGGAARPKSPLIGAATDAAAPSRAIPAAAVRRGPVVSTGARKSNILGAKKATTKLGAMKVTAADDLDFEAAERKAKEEAERIEKLGYDPNADSHASAASTASNIISPTPVSPRGSSFGATQNTRRESEVDKIGTGVARLGFGQLASKPAAAQAAPKRMGFGSVNRGPAGKSKHLRHTTHQLTGNRRHRPCSPRQIRRTKRNLLRRILWPQPIRLQRAIRGSFPVARLRGCDFDIQ